MNRLLVVLALVGVPSQAPEACDMAQKPIAYPGAVLSRNSQIRMQALQGGAYVPMDSASARLPVSFDESLISTAGVIAADADKAAFARLKFRDDADFTASALAAIFGVPNVGSTDVGIAVYEYQPTVSGFTLALVFGGFYTQDAADPDVWPTVLIPIPVPFMFDRTKTYVIGAVAHAWTNFTGSGHHSFTSFMTMPTNSMALGYTSGYASSVQAITRATGWPMTLHADPRQSNPQELNIGTTAMVFCTVFPPGGLVGSIY